MKEKIKSMYAIQLVECLFKFPVITAAKAAALVGCKHATAMTLLKRMVELGMLKMSEKKRDIPFYNEKLIALLEEA